MIEYIDWIRVPQFGLGGVYHATLGSDMLCQNAPLEDKHYQITVMPQTPPKARNQLAICPECRYKFNWVKDNNGGGR